jgi:hypothetical protein
MRRSLISEATNHELAGQQYPGLEMIDVTEKMRDD